MELKIVPRNSPDCKHYRRMSEHDTCEVGIAYADVSKEHERIEYAYSAKSKPPHYSATRSLPCFGESGLNLIGATCEKCEMPTAEELAAEEAEYQRLFERTMTARKAIVAYLGGPWTRGKPGSQGEIDCPICKTEKSLRFTRSGYNGHIHAACKTADCVQWME